MAGKDSSEKTKNNPGLRDVDFDELFKHFVKIQEQHIAFKKVKRIQASSTSSET